MMPDFLSLRSNFALFSRVCKNIIVKLKYLLTDVKLFLPPMYCPRQVKHCKETSIVELKVRKL